MNTVKIYMTDIKTRSFINRIKEICSHETLSAEEVNYLFVSFRVCNFLLAF